VEIIEALVGPGLGISVMQGASPNQECPIWTKWHEAFRVIAYPPYLKRTARIALIFGSLLFAINHLDEVVLGHATAAVWIKGALTFLVPFCVSNLGVLVASRRREDRARQEDGAAR
jgi:hypothetical protein